MRNANLYKTHQTHKWSIHQKAPLKNAVPSHRDSEDIVTPAE